MITSVPDVALQNTQNSFSIITGNRTVNYAVKMGSGNFNLDKSNPKRGITNLRRDNRTGNVTFSVNADLSGFFLSDDYLLNPDNYTLNKIGYQFNVRKAGIGPHGYTHTFKFTADKVHKGNVILRLKSQIPQWVEYSNDEIGITAIEGKTFGIKHQIHGVYEAFTFENNIYTEISINIK